MFTRFARFSAAVCLSAAIALAGDQLGGASNLTGNTTDPPPTGEANPSGNGTFVDITWDTPSGSFSGTWDPVDQRYENGSSWFKFEYDQGSQTNGTFTSNTTAGSGTFVHQ